MIFISVDPDRGTPEKLDEYAKVFGLDFIGVTCTHIEIDLVTESLCVKYKIYSKWSINQKNNYAGSLMQTLTPEIIITAIP